MATNRGAYDPRQFLHYPDKDPFSDGAQKRLDDLINDFLHTGIAYANGASLQDVSPGLEASTRLSHHGLNGILEEDRSSPEDSRYPVVVEDEGEESEDELFRVDKGKGRDAREGPGLQGLWTRTTRLESGTPPQGESVDDAISLSSGSSIVLNDADAEEGQGSYEGDYEEGEALDETGQGYESVEDFGENTDPEPTYDREASAEQDVIYIGDSDEDRDSETAPEGALGAGAHEIHEDVRVNHSPDWASEYDEEEEREGHDTAWDYDGHGSGAIDGQSQEWHHPQGRESDEDEGDFLADEMDREDDNISQMRETDTIPAARRFFTSAPVVDPWVGAGSSGLASLSSAAWGIQSHWMHEHEDENVDEEDADREGAGDVLPTPYVPSQSVPDRGGEEQAEDEANEMGPPPEQQPSQLLETLEPSLLPMDAEAAGILYSSLHIPDPDVVAFATKRTDSPQNVSSITEEQEVHGDSLEDAARIPDCTETTQVLATAIPSLEFPLDAQFQVPVALVDALSTHKEPDPSAPAAGGDPSPSSSITYPPLLEPSATSVEDINFLGVPPSGFTMFAMESDVSPQNGQSPGEERRNENLFMDEMISSGTPTEPILHDATFTPLPSEPNGQMRQDKSPSPVRLNDVASFSRPPHERIDNSATVDIQFIHGNDGIHKSPSVFLHPSDAEERDGVYSIESHSPSPLPPVDPGRMSIECHSIASEDFYGHAQLGDQPIITEVISEYGEEAQEAGYHGEEDEFEELPMQNPGDIASLDHVVYEMTDDGGEARVDTPGAGTQVTEVQNIFMHTIPSGPVPTISVGSSTPPLSPTATVTNASSAPDTSIATSDLSSVNRASVSVATATTPPPIHISRPSPTVADIRQPPVSHVGFLSDDERDNGGEEENVFPDPRLPPEPTHLQIPVGVMGGSLDEDKEERAESVWVEPPTPLVRSEVGDGSSNGESGGVRTEKTPPSPEDHELLRNEAADEKNPEVYPVCDKEISTDSVDLITTNGDEEGSVKKEVEHIGDLAYPDSVSDHPSNDGGLDRSSGDSHASFSPTPIAEAVKPLFESLSPIPENIPSAETVVNGKPSEPSDNDEAHHAESESLTQTNGDQIYTNSHIEIPVENANGRSSEDFLPSRVMDSNILDSSSSRSTPSVSESGSRTKSERSHRRSTKGKGKGKGKAVDRLDARSESPPSATIRVTGKGSPISRKRSHTSETPFSPSKQPRLTRSTTARAKSALSTADVASMSVVSDDKSDVSSVASSSSMVSRILRHGSTGSSSLASISSRSPSVMSQPSPTNAEHSFFIMPPPIRPYVPHNHSHNHNNGRAPAPPVSRSSHRQTTPVSRASPSISPSPSSQPPSRSASTQSTSTHQTRASCTDHKISLPGPHGLLYFLIPRCSLLDPEVEKDARIVDCGAATREEVKRAVGDLEAVGLNSDVLGVIRQLAGVQLMREGQVGYLPKPGERIRVRSKHKRLHIPPPSYTQDAAQEVDPSGPSDTGSSHLAPVDPESVTSPSSSSSSSFSEASKTSEASDHKRFRSRDLKDDHKEFEPPGRDEEEEDSDNNTGVVTETDVTRTAITAPLSSSIFVSSPKLNKARKRGLRKDDAAYQPEKEATESSSDVDSVGAKKKKGKSKSRRSEGSTLGENSLISIIDAGKMPPKRKRKLKDAELSANPDESDDALERRRKKARRRTASKRSPDTRDLKTSV